MTINHNSKISFLLFWTAIKLGVVCGYISPNRCHAEGLSLYRCSTRVQIPIQMLCREFIPVQMYYTGADSRTDVMQGNYPCTDVLHGRGFPYKCYAGRLSLFRCITRAQIPVQMSCWEIIPVQMYYTGADSRTDVMQGEYPCTDVLHGRRFPYRCYAGRLSLYRCITRAQIPVQMLCREIIPVRMYYMGADSRTDVIQEDYPCTDVLHGRRFPYRCYAGRLSLYRCVRRVQIPVQMLCREVFPVQR
jgi:hypothetical protein